MLYIPMCLIFLMYLCTTMYLCTLMYLCIPIVSVPGNPFGGFCLISTFESVFAWQNDLSGFERLLSFQL